MSVHAIDHALLELIELDRVGLEALGMQARDDGPKLVGKMTVLKITHASLYEAAEVFLTGGGVFFWRRDPSAPAGA